MTTVGEPKPATSEGEGPGAPAPASAEAVAAHPRGRGARSTFLWMGSLSVITLVLGVLREFVIARGLRASGSADDFFRGLVIVGACRNFGLALFRARWIPLGLGPAALGVPVLGDGAVEGVRLPQQLQRHVAGRRGQRMTARIEAFPKPFIVAVNGLAYGGGCEITEAAHLAIASEHARFAKPEVAIGIPPTFGGTQRLPRLAGRKRALELLLTGDSFSADHALAIGLVNAVVPPATLLEAARTLADRILRHSPHTVTRILSAVTRGLNLPIAEGLAIEAEQFAIAARSSDTLEGLSAWIDRRPPVYAGG